MLPAAQIQSFDLEESPAIAQRAKEVLQMQRVMNTAFYVVVVVAVVAVVVVVVVVAVVAVVVVVVVVAAVAAVVVAE
jgi:hypothetical protein